MAHFGVFCLPMPSHMNLFLALARTLASRGHRLTFFGISDNETRVRDAGFEFQLLEPDELPVGTLGEMMRQMSTLGNFQSMKLQGKFDKLRYEAILSKGPALIKATSIDSLIVDQAEACTGSVADMLGLPWAGVCSGLCPNSEPAIPPFFTSWTYSDTRLARLRNRLGYTGMKIASRSLQNLINRHRQMWRLPLLTRFDDTFSPFAQISQQNSEFDYPRKELPSCFHYVGPIRQAAKNSVEFPWERLTAQPLVYGSLGTVVNRHKRLLRLVAEACAGLDIQLVLSLGGSGNCHEYDDLPGSRVVVTYAPQIELLSRAALTITHAGLNTTLESLSHGVPLVAIPISFEQPGIAARIRWTSTGDFIPSSKATPSRLTTMIERVLKEPLYRGSAQRMQTALAKTRGSAHAADIIEEVLRTGKPVFRKSV